jgi:hypothetical protein
LEELVDLSHEGEEVRADRVLIGREAVGWDGPGYMARHVVLHPDEGLEPCCKVILLFERE